MAAILLACGACLPFRTAGLGGHPARRQGEPRTLIGHVFMTGATLQRHIVYLKNTETPSHQDLHQRSDGAFRFSGLPEYRL